MSNIEIIKRCYQAFAQGDMPTVLSTLDASVEWTEAEGFPYGGTYVGHEAVLNNVFMKLGGEWDGFRAETDEFLDAGDKIVTLGVYSGRYKATGKSMRAPFAHVWTLRDGKAIKFVQYTDTVKVAEAL